MKLEEITKGALVSGIEAGKRTIYRLATSDKIPAFKLGGTWRFRSAELDQWIASRIGQAADADEDRGAA